MRRIKFDCLVVVAVGDGLSGREIRDQMDDEPYNHDRLAQTTVYNLLDELVEDGMVEKSERNGRTNAYALTDDGRAYLREWRDRLNEALQE